ncbi:unnamed protein product, partial [Adineta ricciae]
LKSGTPQGSPLSPLLYIIYTADSMNGIPSHTEYGLFADDTGLNERLQRSIDASESWRSSWKLKLQPTKNRAGSFQPTPKKEIRTSSGSESRKHHHHSSGSYKILGRNNQQTVKLAETSRSHRK